MKEFFGIPALARTVDTIRRAFGKDVFVSTDSEEIAKEATRYGAIVPFLRPKELAGDHVGDTDVVRHWICGLGLESESTSEIVVYIYPTSVLLEPGELRQAYGEFMATNPSFLVSALPYPHPVERAFTRGEDGRVSLKNSAEFHQRTQDYEPTLHDAGQYYFGTVASWMNESPFTSKGTVARVLSPYSVIDIDTSADWAMAEIIWASRQGYLHGIRGSVHQE